MSSFKKTLKEKWWIMLFVFFVIVRILPNESSNQNSEYHSSSRSNHENYYKWPCKYCGKRLPFDEMLSPNKYPYTPENGFVFCSQECFDAWVLLQYR